MKAQDKKQPDQTRYTPESVHPSQESIDMMQKVDERVMLEEMGNLFSHAEIFLDALERIANPIGAMQQEAEQAGVQLNGMMANEIASHPSYYIEIAKSVLLEYRRSVNALPKSNPLTP